VEPVGQFRRFLINLEVPTEGIFPLQKWILSNQNNQMYYFIQGMIDRIKTGEQVKWSQPSTAADRRQVVSVETLLRIKRRKKMIGLSLQCIWSVNQNSHLNATNKNVSRLLSTHPGKSFEQLHLVKVTL
jgi:hypothetical protein